MVQDQPRTLFDKLWQAHAIADFEGRDTLLYVDRLFLHEGSRHAFAQLEKAGRQVRRPGQVITCADHYVTTTNRARGIDGIPAPEVREAVELLERNAGRHGVAHIGMTDPRQGILHVVGPEQGLVQPGYLIVGNDSHTCTHGAFGALAFGIGTSDVTHVLASQTIWQRRPRTMRIRVDGRLGAHVTAKDLALDIVRRIGVGGALGHAVEYAGSTVRALSMEARMTLCNLAVEAGARAGLIAPDDTTIAFLEGRPEAPQGEHWERAVAWWRTLASDADASFDRDIAIAAEDVAATVTWGTDPSQAVSVTGGIPDPADETDPARRDHMIQALDYMGLKPGTRLADIPVDRVFIGSCTNGRIEDLRAVASIVRSRAVTVPTLVVPGSTAVKRQAEAEGLDVIFKEAGMDWRDSACSMCTTGNGEDMLKPGERCISTSNRNFRGRQGPEGRTHLASPASAAAAALTGRITDVREIVE